VHFLFFLPFSFQLSKCIFTRCDDVEMKCSCIEASRMSIEATTIEFALSLFFLSTNLILNRDKTKKRKEEKKRCELSVFLLYLFIHIHYLFSMRMHLFKSIYAYTHKVTNMIIIPAHSMCQNYHIYFIWSRLYMYIYTFFDPVQYFFFI